MYAVKRQGFSDRQIAFASKTSEDEVRQYRQQLGVNPVYKNGGYMCCRIRGVYPLPLLHV